MLHPQEAACDVGATHLGVYTYPLCAGPWETHARRPCPLVKNSSVIAIILCDMCTQVSPAFRAKSFGCSELRWESGRCWMSPSSPRGLQLLGEKLGVAWFELFTPCYTRTGVESEIVSLSLSCPCPVSHLSSLQKSLRWFLSYFQKEVLCVLFDMWYIYGKRNFKKSPGSPSWSLSPNVKADFGSQRMLLSKDTDVYHRHNS